MTRPNRKPSAGYQIEMQGGGLYAAAKSALTSILHGGRREAPPAVRKILQDSPGARVVKVQSAVVPVGKPLTKFLDWVSGGKYEQKRQQLGYNDINHAYLIVTLDNGKTYRLEKNHVVEMYSYDVKNDKNQKLDLQLSGTPELSSFLSNAEKYQESGKSTSKRGNFWQYDPQNNNCQYFVDDIVKGNAEITNKEEANKFFFQPGSGELIDTTGKWKPHIKYIVPLATIGDRLINGQGITPGHREDNMNARPQNRAVTPQETQDMFRQLQRLRAQLMEARERYYAHTHRHSLLGPEAVTHYQNLYSDRIANLRAQIARLEPMLELHRGGSIIRQPRCAHRYSPY